MGFSFIVMFWRVFWKISASVSVSFIKYCDRLVSFRKSANFYSVISYLLVDCLHDCFLQTLCISKQKYRALGSFSIENNEHPIRGTTFSVLTMQVWITASTNRIAVISREKRHCLLCAKTLLSSYASQVLLFPRHSRVSRICIEGLKLGELLREINVVS